MKLTLIGPVSPYKGGISHFTEKLDESLNTGHDVQLISWKRRYPKFLVKNQTEKSKGGLFESKKEIFVLDYLNPLTWIKTIRMIRKHESKFVLFNWVSPVMTPVFTPLAIMIKLFSDAKPLMIAHCPTPHENRFIDSFLTKICFLNFNYFIAHSKSDAEVVKKNNKKAQVVVSFLPNLCDFDKAPYEGDLRKELGLKSKVILFFGFIREYKGVKYLIKAMPEIIKKIDASLLIVGEFWGDSKEYEELIEKEGLKNKVVLVNKYVPNEEVGKYFEVSDILVLPYTSATQSGIVQTAYYFDKPCIVSNIGGLQESVEDGKTGLLVEPKSSRAIADATIKFYESADKNILIKNIQLRKKKYDWRRYVQIMENSFFN